MAEDESVESNNAQDDLSGIPGVGEGESSRNLEGASGNQEGTRRAEQERPSAVQEGDRGSQQEEGNAQEETRGADLNDDNPFTEDGNNQEVGEVPFQFGNGKERFRTIDPSTYQKLIKRLVAAFPNRKVFVDADKMKRRLERLGYNVQALFGNEVMAFTPQTKRLLERAKKLNKQGKTARETREETGWFIGLDGNWKYAIDDSNARLLEDEKRIASLAKNKTVDTAKSYPLKGVLSHPELEQLYPELIDKINVKFYEGPEQEGGSVENHSNGTYTLRINKDFRETNSGRGAIRPVILHEIQHVIQGLERSLRGARSNDVGGSNFKLLYNQLKKGALKLYNEGSKEEIQYKHLSDNKLRNLADFLYNTHSEEIEARAAGNGNDLAGELSNLKQPFYWVESIDRNNEVVLRSKKGVHFVRNNDEIERNAVEFNNGNCKR